MQKTCNLQCDKKKMNAIVGSSYKNVPYCNSFSYYKFNYIFILLHMCKGKVYVYTNLEVIPMKAPFQF
jgi:hypothetical protein